MNVSAQGSVRQEPLKRVSTDKEPIYENNTTERLYAQLDASLKSEDSEIQRELKEDFKALKELDKANKEKYPAEETNDTDNKEKNRYKDITAYDHSIVRLEKTKTNPTGYINANYVGKEKKYIAAQGPLEGTAEDFWQMVWESGSDEIVMVTREKEGKRTKCHNYWPEPGAQKKFGKFKATLVRTTEKDPIEREIKLSYKGRSRTIKHTQLTSWPDHGAPKRTTEFLKMTDQTNPKKDKPVIVHCSAGVGRTGTFIGEKFITNALERGSYTLEHDIKIKGFDLKAGTKIELGNKKSIQDIKELTLIIIADMKSYRNYLVQSEPQLPFLIRATLAWMNNTSTQKHTLIDGNSKNLKFTPPEPKELAEKHLGQISREIATQDDTRHTQFRESLNAMAKKAAKSNSEADIQAFAKLCESAMKKEKTGSRSDVSAGAIQKAIKKQDQEALDTAKRHRVKRDRRNHTTNRVKNAVLEATQLFLDKIHTKEKASSPTTEAQETDEEEPLPPLPNLSRTSSTETIYDEIETDKPKTTDEMKKLLEEASTLNETDNLPKLLELKIRYAKMFIEMNPEAIHETTDENGFRYYSVVIDKGYSVKKGEKESNPLFKHTLYIQMGDPKDEETWTGYEMIKSKWTQDVQTNYENDPEVREKYGDNAKLNIEHMTGGDRFLKGGSKNRIGGGAFGEASYCYEITLDENNQPARKLKIAKRVEENYMGSLEEAQAEYQIGKTLQAQGRVPGVIPATGITVAPGKSGETQVTLFMDPIPGEELFEETVKNALSNEDKETIATLLIEKIQRLHEKGISHRDLKPENIKVIRDKKGKIITIEIYDLGLATTEKRSGKECGTPEYMPTEMIEDNDYEPRKADETAIAIILLELFEPEATYPIMLERKHTNREARYDSAAAKLADETHPFHHWHKVVQDLVQPHNQRTYILDQIKAPERPIKQVLQEAPPLPPKRGKTETNPESEKEDRLPELPLKHQPYYRASINRKTAESELKSETKKFLVRSKVENEETKYALSVQTEETIKHFQIHNDQNGFYIMKDTIFDNIPELIKHYTTHKLGDIILTPTQSETQA